MGLLKGLGFFFFLVLPFLVQAQVVVIGYGATESEALKSAFVNAVDQSVGVLISAKLYVENGELIEDKVLALSSGFIESYKHINTERFHGDYKVTIEAVVKTEAVKAKVTEVFKSEVGIDISEFATAYTKSNRNASAKEIIQDEFPKLAEALVDSLRMDIVNVKIESDKATDTVPFTVDLRLSVDKAKYDAVLKELDKHFVQFGAKKTAFTSKGQIKANSVYLLGTDGKGYGYEVSPALEGDLLDTFFSQISKGIGDISWGVDYVNKDGSRVNNSFDIRFKGKIMWSYRSLNGYLNGMYDGGNDSDVVLAVSEEHEYAKDSYIEALGWGRLGSSRDNFYKRAKIVLPFASLNGVYSTLYFSELNKPMTTDFYIEDTMTMDELENLRKIEVVRVR
jgi:hypothetical protein